MAYSDFGTDTRGYFNPTAGRRNTLARYKKEEESASIAAAKQRMDELDKMRALALNARPEGAAGVSIAGGSLINAGEEIGRQMAYDRNRAAVNNPQAILNLLKEGSADVGGPRVKKIMEDQDRLDQDEGNLDLEQLERDVSFGQAPGLDQVARAARATNKRTRSGRLAEGVLQAGAQARQDRVSLLNAPLPEETPQYQVPSFESPQEAQRYTGDVLPIRGSTKISRDKKSLIPYFTNF